MKRGESGLSLVLAVEKPVGITSHDCINRVRTIFKEKRVGHLGTLDPDACGVLPICVGPATRLNKYLVEHDKTYRFSIKFGTSTTTDDASGDILQKTPIPSEVKDGDYATDLLSTFLGRQLQIPPTYSALKQQGVKACDAARKGLEMTFEPRPIEVYDLFLENIDSQDDEVIWTCVAHVSKGTYIRALARDIGKRASTSAHVCYLQRIKVGSISIDDCYTFQEIEELQNEACLNPLHLLQFPVLETGFEFDAIENGNKIMMSDYVLQNIKFNDAEKMELQPGEYIAIVSRPCDSSLGKDTPHSKELKAIYRFDQAQNALVADCVFSKGVFLNDC